MSDAPVAHDEAKYHLWYLIAILLPEAEILLQAQRDPAEDWDLAPAWEAWHRHVQEALEKALPDAYAGHTAGVRWSVREEFRARYEAARQHDAGDEVDPASLPEWHPDYLPF